MVGKLKKGYYVKGQFVAEGSELDLQYKRDLKGTDEPTRTELKRESEELQKLGTEMLTLSGELMQRLDLPDKLVDGLAEARRITNFEGKRRQMQFIGKLMRQLPVEKHEEIRAALVEQHTPSAQETMLLHESENWRKRLVEHDDAFAQWMNLATDTDSQQLRALIRQARKDAVPEKPGQAVRHGRAWREIFQIVRAQLLEHHEQIRDGRDGRDSGDDDTDDEIND